MYKPHTKQPDFQDWFSGISLRGSNHSFLISEHHISSAQTALPPKVGRRSLLHGGFVCESRYFRLDYKTQNVPSLQVRAVMEKCNRFFFFWVGFATQIFRAVHTRTTGSGTRARVVRTGFRPGSDTRVVVEAVKRGGGKLSVTIFCNNIYLGFLTDMPKNERSNQGVPHTNTLYSVSTYRYDITVL